MAELSRDIDAPKDLVVMPGIVDVLVADKHGLGGDLWASDHEHDPPIAICVPFVGAWPGTEAYVSVVCGRWTARHRLDLGGPRPVPAGDVVYEVPGAEPWDPPVEASPPRVVVEATALGRDVRHRVGNLLLKLMLREGLARRQRYVDHRQDTADDDDQMRAWGRVVSAQDRRVVVEERDVPDVINLMPRSRAGRPTSTTAAVLVEVEQRLRQEHGRDYREWHLADELGVHVKSLPRLRKRLGISKTG